MKAKERNRLSFQNETWCAAQRSAATNQPSTAEKKACVVKHKDLLLAPLLAFPVRD
jgi:hypothetical protein